MPSEEFATRSEAMAREKELKALRSKRALLKLVDSGRVPTSRDRPAGRLDVRDLGSLVVRFCQLAGCIVVNHI